ncbi:MAG: PQQ-binding-like beta-propeller repeat protein [Hyphomonadaceae bacterium]|nr:PQQ-binding-like beta-propeller repeat protein [Hyphomonadaceae bacterium]
MTPTHKPVEHAAMRIFALFSLLCMLFLAPAARAEEADISGWWRADITQGDETERFYFHFIPDEKGGPRMRFSIPVARMSEVRGGAYAVEGDHVRLLAFGLDFTLDASRQSMSGVFPPTFVSGLEVPVQFVRSEAPPELPDLPTALGPAPSPAWSVSLGAEVWAGLVRDGARTVFVADDAGRVTALAQRDGAQRWQVDLGAPIRATPALFEGRLYVASDAALVALDARNGRQIWSSPFGPERAPRLPITHENSKWDHYSSGAAVDDDMAVVGSRDGCVYAFATRTGAQLWRTCTEDLVTSTPALTQEAVFFGGYDHFAYALSRADGRQLWRRDTHDAIPRDVAIAGDNVLFGSRSYSLLALNARTGEPAWTRHVWYSWIDSPAVVADGRIYTGTSDAAAVFAYDAASGAPVWKTPVPGWTWGGVALSEHALFTGIAGASYSTPRAGGLAALRRSDGVLRWMLPSAAAADPAQISGFAAQPVVSGARVFAADLTGQVYAFDDPGS